MSNLLISRKSLQAEAKSLIESGNAPAVQLVDFSSPTIGGEFGKMKEPELYSAVAKLGARDMVASAVQPKFKVSGKYGGGFYTPMKWSNESEMSAHEWIMANRPKFKDAATMMSNTLPVDWANLWDALRIDVSVRKAALGTIRQFIYNITVNPNFTRTINPTEISPFGIVFEENNGHGQSVPQGETLGGGFDAITILIYAAGFTWDLIAELFDLTITPERGMDAFMLCEDALKDDIAISPILDFAYAGVQQTAAATTPSGANRQELLYNTLDDALDDLGNRDHPVTDRKLDVTNVVVLAHPFDARHIARVSGGLPSVNERVYNAISEIRQVIAYDDEVIVQRAKTTTYSGVTQGTAYMIIPASAIGQTYMQIPVKRDLVIEIDERPDVKTLTREERAYWFAEGIWHHGIQYFIQEITLPAW